MKLFAFKERRGTGQAYNYPAAYQDTHVIMAETKEAAEARLRKDVQYEFLGEGAYATIHTGYFDHILDFKKDICQHPDEFIRDDSPTIGVATCTKCGAHL